MIIRASVFANLRHPVGERCTDYYIEWAGQLAIPPSLSLSARPRRNGVAKNFAAGRSRRFVPGATKEDMRKKHTERELEKTGETGEDRGR